MSWRKEIPLVLQVLRATRQVTTHWPGKMNEAMSTGKGEFKYSIRRQIILLFA